MVSFNLVEEPWVPCISINEQDMILSLPEVFEKASHIREIVHTSPLVIDGLHRLFLAILHRNFGPGTLGDWHRIWKDRCWNLETVNGYLYRWLSRFDLFDPHYPFYQTPYMQDAIEHPIALLIEEKASGNNPTLFDHNMDHTPSPMKPADSACYLIARQAYSVGGGVSKPFNLSHSTLVRGLSVRFVGDNLFETLMLNLVRYNEHIPIPQLEEDTAVWEREEPRLPDKEGTIPTGYVDYLTWQSRRIHLIPNGDPPMVIRCQIQQNLKLAEGHDDPFKVYRKDTRTGWKSIGLNESKALWRDSHALLRDTDEAHRPAVVNWVARINRRFREQGDKSIRPKYPLEVTGVATDPRKAASIIFWRHERLPLPLAYLSDKQLVDRLGEMLTLTEKMARGLDGVVSDMAQDTLGLAKRPPTRQGRGRIDEHVRHLGANRAFWSHLEEPFKRLLVELPDDKDEESEYGGVQIGKWKSTLRHALWKAFRESTRGMERSTRNLKAAALAERSLTVITRKHLAAHEAGDLNDAA